MKKLSARKIAKPLPAIQEIEQLIDRLAVVVLKFQLAKIKEQEQVLRVHARRIARLEAVVFRGHIPSFQPIKSIHLN